MDKETKLRGYAAIFFTIVSAVLTVAIFIYAISHGGPFGRAAISALMLGFALGGLIPGVIHFFPKLKNLLYIPFIGWAAFLILILVISEFSGWIFNLIDLFRFLKARKEN